MVAVTSRKLLNGCTQTCPQFPPTYKDQYQAFLSLPVSYSLLAFQCTAATHIRQNPSVAPPPKLLVPAAVGPLPTVHLSCPAESQAEDVTHQLHSSCGVTQSAIKGEVQTLSRVECTIPH